MKGNIDEALGYYHEANKLAEKTSAGGPSEVFSTTNYYQDKIAQICQKQGRYSDAEPKITSILNRCRSMYGARYLQESSMWTILECYCTTIYDTREHTGNHRNVFSTCTCIRLRFGVFNIVQQHSSYLYYSS